VRLLTFVPDPSSYPLPPIPPSAAEPLLFSLVVAQSFVVREEKRLVPLDWPAEYSAKLIPFQRFHAVRHKPAIHSIEVVRAVDQEIVGFRPLTIYG
jgi:hypothetical protein